jgi:hypothetical protein
MAMYLNILSHSGRWRMTFAALRLWLFGFPLAMVGVACGSPVSRLPLEADRSEAIRDSVKQFFESIPATLTEDGPIAWLRHFEEGPEFFMASDGELAFPSSDSAKAFVRLLSQRISAIRLLWADMRVVPLGPGIAVVGATYRETVTDTAGTEVDFGGFMTGVSRHHQEGWRIQNLHWSSPVPSRE